MDENEIESKALSSSFSRYKSPTFHQSEVTALLKLIEKHKNVIMNKATNSAVNLDKQKSWRIIARDYNKLNLGQERTAEVLKTKWENLKRTARRSSKELMDDHCEFNRDEVNKTLTLIGDQNRIHELDEQSASLKDIIGCGDGDADFNIWASENEDETAPFALGEDIEDMGKNASNKRKLSSGFSPQDCRMLLQCVRQEKNILFSDSTLFKRQQAWKRIAETYNRQSPQKKTSKELSKKFNSLKTMAKRINVKGLFLDKKRKTYEQLNEDRKPKLEKVKAEPIIDCAAEYNFDSDDDDVILNHPVDITNNDRLSFAQDPLNNAHSSNSDSGLGSIPETKNATRLKLELLNYKMETAKLERKRIEEAIKADQKERELRNLEQTLRLRAARLELAAAEAKFSPSHPALKYTTDEKILLY